jgi:hypothetical protein
LQQRKSPTAKTALSFHPALTGDLFFPSSVRAVFCVRKRFGRTTSPPAGAANLN